MVISVVMLLAVATSIATLIMSTAMIVSVILSSSCRNADDVACKSRLPAPE